MLSTTNKIFKYAPWVVVVILLIVLAFGGAQYQKSRDEAKRDKILIDSLKVTNVKLMLDIKYNNEQRDSLMIVIKGNDLKIDSLQKNEQKLINEYNEKIRNIPNLSDSELQQLFTEYFKDRSRTN